MIRTAQIQDIPDILQVIHASIRSCVLDHQHQESQIQICLEHISQENLLLWLLYNDSWVHVINGYILGFILVNDQGKILLHYVSPDSQQQGIGKSLLFHVIAHAQQQKRRKITLDSTQTALAFYQKYGFETRQRGISNKTLIALVNYLA
ncbi:GNAT family N-acetyltransferase [Acinetobacter bouvetii]|uniref:Putative acetyltransferase n=1 Tax=Acinetobacter bouvetii TaxID=202951 RepID=A0A811GAF0_9GAMM|nr:GNAT family N-acetyltransferase [Acinetobacter bouvetii]CAB1216112.1 putative acetyltransferase [Acinetobacter bouvetii]